jgi:alkanesulfonate monooxygenase SsuD/methylene tetrahydromethanopterin reductase-like flavin-dependent oxidoreductase (luciferase family)
MSVEFIGMIGRQLGSETHPPHGPVIDIDYVRRFAQALMQQSLPPIYFLESSDVSIAIAGKHADASGLCRLRTWSYDLPDSRLRPA